METKGKAVDSVIQYQLHKQTGGEGGDSFKCNYQEPLMVKFTTEEIVFTQELLDTDPVLRNTGIIVGSTGFKIISNITPQDVLNRALIFYEIEDGYFYYRTLSNNTQLSLSLFDDVYYFETHDNISYFLNIPVGYVIINTTILYSKNSYFYTYLAPSK